MAHMCFHADDSAIAMQSMSGTPPIIMWGTPMYPQLFLGYLYSENPALLASEATIELMSPRL